MENVNISDKIEDKQNISNILVETTTILKMSMVVLMMAMIFIGHTQSVKVERNSE